MNLTAQLYKLWELTAHLKRPFSGLWRSLSPSSSHPSGSRSPSSPCPVQGCEFSANTISNPMWLRAPSSLPAHIAKAQASVPR